MNLLSTHTLFLNVENISVVMLLRFPDCTESINAWYKPDFFHDLMLCAFWFSTACLSGAPIILTAVSFVRIHCPVPSYTMIPIGELSIRDLLKLSAVVSSSLALCSSVMSRAVQTTNSTFPAASIMGVFLMSSRQSSPFPLVFHS